ncbi:hypothetical protein EM6_2697 [Asticcacaulis excentricus]|uniref:Uncharacterized protein n=1 Tax=Asticcacaulis excentricus TaxID=78587 RepID=A0A3G9G5X5_9CAUL|nr:hypothetical protein EM6_2697 [Asticcacaulis excentricus]
MREHHDIPQRQYGYGQNIKHYLLLSRTARLDKGVQRPPRVKIKGAFSGYIRAMSAQGFTIHLRRFLG